MKRYLSTILLIWFYTASFSQVREGFVQKDLSDLLHFVVHKTDTNHFEQCDYDKWLEYLSRQHPNTRTLNKYFEDAADEFDVPIELLKVIAYVESNWTQIGPSIDRGWGLMHLVENSYSNTLSDAAELLELDTQVLKDDAQQNIRGMAALIAKVAKTNKAERNELVDWFDVLTSVTGLYSTNLAEIQVLGYYSVLNQGVESITLWGEKYYIEPQHTEFHEYLNLNKTDLFTEKNQKSLDYGPAISYITPCNFTESRNHVVDTWVNHWIGVGTYAGAISWFHNCDAEVSAHFVIRSSDGEITQVVRVANTAWHCGASGYPYNNSRSIGVEHEATITNPELWNSMPMLTASAEMASYFCNLYSIPKTLSLPGIRGHNDMPGTNTDCPGNLPWFTWMTLLDENYADADLVIMDMWTEPEPQQSIPISLFVEIGNVGSDPADSIFLNYRIDNEIVGFDSLLFLDASETYTFSFPNYTFASQGYHDYCVYIDAVSNESNTVNNSYCIELNVIPPSSVSENSFQNKISLYPNPTHGLLNFEAGNIKLIEIYNAQGILIKTIKNPNTHQINMSPFANGFYLIVLVNEDGFPLNCRVLKQ